MLSIAICLMYDECNAECIMLGVVVLNVVAGENCCD
jgi:hypothetical protein